MNGPNRQRLALAVAALLGALTPLLPWAQLGPHVAPLTVDPVGSVIVAGGFVAVAGLALVGDRSRPLRSSLPVALAVSVACAGLLGFVVRAGVLTAREGVELGVGAYAAGVVAVFVGVGAWVRTS